MKVTVPWRNVRSVPTTAGNNPLKHLGAGDTVAVTGSVQGQDPYQNGLRTWYRLTDSTYMWASGLVEVKAETKTAPSTPSNKANADAKPVGATVSTVTKYAQPVSGVLTSGFGMRWGAMHQGIDIAGPIGRPIYAVTAGEVISAGPASGFGLWVRLRHSDGTITVYGHVNRYFVQVGQKVPAGYKIAEVGNRGDSHGPHLHFEVWQSGRPTNPLPWLAARGIRY